ncbi:hypothetical protein GCM10022233_44280 [Streptomyces shaanxiensis]|uniref:Uncharacterized protein n=1 Tax=Streptomyces shaanxiensis TaxID=653357 RepID=A0ABP7VDZ9_9ACTN
MDTTPATASDPRTVVFQDLLIVGGAPHTCVGNTTACDSHGPFAQVTGVARPYGPVSRRAPPVRGPVAADQPIRADHDYD